MKKNLRISINSPVILGFCGICLAALLLGSLTGEHTTALFFSVYRSSMLDPLTYIRFFGHVFGHASWEHLLSNLMLLLLVGPMLEEKYGGRMLIEVMAVTAFVTGLVHFVLFPGSMLLGASGVVFALILLSSFTSFQEGSIPLTFLLVAALYLGREAASGLFELDHVSNLTHILGGAVGSGFGYMLMKRR